MEQVVETCKLRKLKYIFGEGIEIFKRNRKVYEYLQVEIVE